MSFPRKSCPQVNNILWNFTLWKGCAGMQVHVSFIVVLLTICSLLKLHEDLNLTSFFKQKINLSFVELLSCFYLCSVMLSENGLPPMYYFYSLKPQKTLHGSHVFHSTNFELFISIYFQFKKKKTWHACVCLWWQKNRTTQGKTQQARPTERHKVVAKTQTLLAVRRQRWPLNHRVIIKQIEILLLLLNAPLSRVIYLHFTMKTETMPHKINWSMVIWAFAV